MHYRDLRSRLPHATVHRFERAGHLLPDEADVAGAVETWLSDLPRARASAAANASGGAATAANGDGAPELVGGVQGAERDRPPLWHFLDERADDDTPAIIEAPVGGGSGPARTVSWGELSRKTRQGAAGLAAMGVRRGDRVALLVPPGPDLTIAMCACIRMGAVIVVADAGLGVQGLHRAIRSANPQYLIGIDRALAAARALNWGGKAIAVGPGNKLKRAALGASVTLDDVIASGEGLPLPPSPAQDDELGVLFTSGSTGPAKGVVYTHRQIEASRDLILATYNVNASDRFVAAFAPFALLGPQLGATASVPNMDVTAPATLTAAALADAVAASDATQVFASPAALVNVARTAGALNDSQREALQGVRLLFSAGAPVPISLLKEMVALMPNATPHTPYGMTEALPVTDVTMDELVEAGPGNGVLVGRPVEGVEVAISACDSTGAATGELSDEPEITGEIVVRGPHVKAHYDQLWVTEHASSSRPYGWHRTGDVGHLDATGRLWVEGRLAHVLSTPDGVLTPVGVEQRVQEVPQAVRAAIVGVGPKGVQQAVAVVETEQGSRRGGGLATPELAEAVRKAAGVELAAVLAVGALPTDIRHNSKIDRTRVARWADRVLAGRRGGRL
jgi:acyl-coenzyme A synthetase/AMP-(fatty) acid ligase